MSQEVIIIDDFYDIPHQYHKSFFENQCFITDETYDKISKIVGNKIEIIGASNEILSEDKNTSVCSHLLADWIAVIYLSLPLVSFGEFGIKFYSHLSTGLETFPTEEEKRKHNLKEDNLLNIFLNHSDLWKEYGSILAKYNRMILFRANRWHSYGNGFGENINTSMLYQKIILKNAY